MIDPGDEAGPAHRSARRARRDGRGDPDHALPLRPRRRGRRDGARTRGAPVYCPEVEVLILEDINAYVRSRASGRSRPTRPRRRSRAARGSTLAGFEIDVIVHARPQPRPRDVLDPADEGDASRGDVLFQGSIGRTDLPGRRPPDAAATRSPTLLDTLPDETARAARPHGPDHARPRARQQPVPARARAVERADPGTARHVRRAAATRRWRARALEARRASDPRARRLRADRDADVRGDRSCSRAAWGRRPTSSRRRCTPSTTATGSRSRCAPRAPRRSAAPTSSTACTSSRSR